MILTFSFEHEPHIMVVTPSMPGGAHRKSVFWSWSVNFLKKCQNLSSKMVMDDQRGSFLTTRVLTSVGSILKQVYWRCTFEHLLILPHSTLLDDCIQVFVMRFGKMHPGKDFHQRHKYNFLLTVQYHKRFGMLLPYEVTIFDNAEVEPFRPVRGRLVSGPMLWARHRLMILNQSVRKSHASCKFCVFCCIFAYFRKYPILANFYLRNFAVKIGGHAWGR